MLVGVFIFGFVALALCAGLYVRNHNVYKVRGEFIDDPALWPQMFSKLPLYHEMCEFKHWDKWTKQEWIDFINEQEKQK